MNFRSERAELLERDILHLFFSDRPAELIADDLDTTISLVYQTIERLQKRIIAAYAEGSTLHLIADSFGLETENVSDMLNHYRKSCRTPRTFTDEFKKLIAERDLTGAARMEIARELGINVNTVKKACEEFGQKNKDRTDFERLHTKIDGDFPKDECYKCGSKHLNEVDDIGTTYCFDCGSEFTHMGDHILALNWEFVD